MLTRNLRDIIVICVLLRFLTRNPTEGNHADRCSHAPDGGIDFEGTITKWLKQPGEKVQRDEPLFEISTDKVDAEIPAPAVRHLQEIKVAGRQYRQVNTVVGTSSPRKAMLPARLRAAEASHWPLAPGKPAAAARRGQKRPKRRRTFLPT